MGKWFQLFAASEQSVDVQFGLSWDVNFAVGNDWKHVLGIKTGFIARRIGRAAVKLVSDVGGVESVEDGGLGPRLRGQKILPGQRPNYAVGISIRRNRRSSAGGEALRTLGHGRRRVR